MAPAGSMDSPQALGQPLELQDLSPISEITKSKPIEELSAKIQELTSHVLQFLSDATNETLGACLVGLGAITYLVLGRVGLVLIGVVGGVVLHATWEENNHNQADENIRVLEATKKRERGLDVIERILDWRERRKDGVFENDHPHDQDSAHSVSSEKDFSGFQPAVRAALTNLTDAVIRDYVKYNTHAGISDDGC